MADKGKQYETDPLVWGFKSGGKQSQRRPLAVVALLLFVVVVMMVVIAVSVTLGVVLTLSSSNSTTVCNTTLCESLAEQVLSNVHNMK